MLIPLALILTACNGSTNYVSVKPNIGSIDQRLLWKCPTLKKLPERELTQKEVEKLWGMDTVLYKRCAGNNNALVDAIQSRDQRFNSE